MIVVRDFVGNVGELRLEAGLAPFEESRAELAELARMPNGTVFEDSLAGLVGQVQPAESRVALLEQIDDTQRLQVVLEPSELAHAFVERILARVAEGRMPEVVREAHRFDEVFVETHRPGDGTRDLGDLEIMRQARGVEIPFVVDENLCLVDQAPKCRRVNDPIAVTLKFGAVQGRVFGERKSTRL